MAQVPMPWSCIQSDFIELGSRKLEGRKIEMGARKMGDQKRLTCQKHKVKERNVANNYEKKFKILYVVVGYNFS